MLGAIGDINARGNLKIIRAFEPKQRPELKIWRVMRVLESLVLSVSGEVLCERGGSPGWISGGLRRFAAVCGGLRRFAAVCGGLTIARRAISLNVKTIPKDGDVQMN
jgi:hypothetical protein